DVNEAIVFSSTWNISFARLGPEVRSSQLELEPRFEEKGHVVQILEDSSLYRSNSIGTSPFLPPRSSRTCFAWNQANPASLRFPMDSGWVMILINIKMTKVNSPAS